MVRREGRLAHVTLHRPPLNILDLEMIAALEVALAGLADDEELALVRLRGDGGRAFSAGVSVHDHTPDKLERMLEGFHGVVRRLREMAPVTLAVVEGHCLGGGMELALTCDLVLAAEGSRFGQPEIQLGCYPPVAAALYPGRIGPGHTLDLLLTGRTLGCAEAERLGLVTWRVADAALEGRLTEVTDAITSKSAPVVRLTKRAVRAGAGRDFAAALAEAERLYLDKLTRTEDMGEGIKAFIDKRPPQWRHR
jgi:cyclohexa-1,5-dienecarbonyl-CoA hydratase